MAFQYRAGNGRVLAKRKNTHVKGIVEDRLKASTLVSCLIVTGLTAMILFNLLVPGGQSTARVIVPDGTTTKVTVAVPGKSSQTVTIRYDELVEDVQQQLLALGHFRSMVDGVDGPMTREAIIRYQREQKLEETGDVSSQLLEHIEYTRKLAQAAEFTGSVRPTESLPVVAPAKPKLKKPVVVQQPAQEPVDQKILAIQKRLARLGFDPGVRNGKLDDATRSAILTFEMENGLAMEGGLSKTFLAALKNAESRVGKAN